MVYTPGTWTENTTVIHAADMIRIEAGIAAASFGTAAVTSANNL